MDTSKTPTSTNAPDLLTDTAQEGQEATNRQVTNDSHSAPTGGGLVGMVADDMQADKEAVLVAQVPETAKDEEEEGDEGNVRVVLRFQTQPMVVGGPAHKKMRLKAEELELEEEATPLDENKLAEVTSGIQRLKQKHEDGHYAGDPFGNEVMREFIGFFGNVADYLGHYKATQAKEKLVVDLKDFLGSIALLNGKP
jgi:hypothetical protein